MDTDDKSEAELIASYLSRKYDIRDILLETNPPTAVIMSLMPWQNSKRQLSRQNR
jgi:hypothetical protein